MNRVDSDTDSDSDSDTDTEMDENLFIKTSLSKTKFKRERKLQETNAIPQVSKLTTGFRMSPEGGKFE